LTGCLWAQDIHWSQFNWSPLNLNPALTGNFDGRWRFTGNYKDQWRAVSRPFQTIGISVDSRDFLNARNMNLGLLFYHDIAGTSKFKTVNIGIPFSYRIGLGRDSVHCIHLGFIPSFQQQSLDPSALTFDDQFNGWRYDPQRTSRDAYLIADKNSLVNFGAGITYTHQSKKGWSLMVGYGAQNITNPHLRWMLGENAKLWRRDNFHAFAYLPVGKRWFLTPSAVYSKQGKASELLAGSEINMLLDHHRYRYRAVFLGAFTRFSDAYIGVAGFYYNSWRFGVSYDINASPFVAATNMRGGIEFSVIYILRELLPGRDNFKYCPVFL
jgi:type IX secretion system PorP/SprF family membrane protein